MKLSDKQKSTAVNILRSLRTLAVKGSGYTAEKKTKYSKKMTDKITRFNNALKKGKGGEAMIDACKKAIPTFASQRSTATPDFGKCDSAFNLIYQSVVTGERSGREGTLITDSKDDLMSVFK